MSQSVNAPGYPLCLAGSMPWLVGSPGHQVYGPPAFAIPAPNPSAAIAIPPATSPAIASRGQTFMARVDTGPIATDPNSRWSPQGDEAAQLCAVGVAIQRFDALHNDVWP